MTPLEKFVKENGGKERVAEKIGVSSRVIYYYLDRRMVPGLEISAKLVKLSGGKLSFSDIWNSTKPIHKGK